PPIVSLNLGSTLSPEDIKEGDDVYFECHIRANPPWSKLTWIHDVHAISPENLLCSVADATRPPLTCLALPRHSSSTATRIQQDLSAKCERRGERENGEGLD
ncbi:unnamed protein product, partial [Heterotrigona itama]